MEENEFNNVPKDNTEEVTDIEKDVSQEQSQEQTEQVQFDIEELDTRQTQTIVEQPPQMPKYNAKKEVFEWIEAIVFAVVIAMLIRTFVFTLVVVDGPSMQDTLHTGDRLYVSRFMYTPKDGDIVVFKPENYKDRPFIKRVIATEGETVDIDYITGTVTVDGKVLDEPYIKAPTNSPNAIDPVRFPITVPKGHVFCMGDNRPMSHDCRSKDVGSLDTDTGSVNIKNSVIGKAMFRFWPLSKFGSLY